MMQAQTELRHTARILGLALLIYWVMLQAAVLLLPDSPGWNYLLALALSFFCYTRWKTPDEFQQMLSHREKTMTVSCFLGLLCLVIGCQLAAQLSDLGLRLLADALNRPVTDLMGQKPVDALEPAVFVYACILGPIAEELLFRGILLWALAPYGKKLAVFVSALLFALFHGNLLQGPYAFLLGLVLGYCGLEYRLVWAMALHVGSNLLFGCLLPRLLAGLPAVTQGFWTWTVIVVTAFSGLCLLLSKFDGIRAWCRENSIKPGQLATVFTTGTVLTFAILSILNMIF